MKLLNNCLKNGALAAFLIAGTVQAASISTATVDTAATFTLASSPLGGIVGCELDGNLPNTYGTTTFTTTFAETYSFTAIGATGDPALVNDPFLAIYEGSFDPANPTVNLVGCNDDKSSADRFPEFSAALKANTTYVMVATTYAGGAQSGTVTISAGIVPALSLANFSASVGATGQSMVATSHSTGTITYSIDNPSVATIDPSTGALTLLALGTATVTATIAPQPDTGPNAGPYNGGTTTATLTVTAATQSSVQPVPTLSEWAMIVMASMMGMLAISRIRRKN